MTTKSEQLQIRVTPREKGTLKRLARRAGQDLSSYVLAQALPDLALEVDALLQALRSGEDRRFVLAALNDLLTDLPPVQFAGAVARADVRGLPPFERNYVAAMVEHAAAAKGVGAPSWAPNVPALGEPWFATNLESVRLHLLRASPVAFKRRNLFVDASVGDRV